MPNQFLIFSFRVKEQKKEIRLLKVEHQKIFEAQQTGLHELEARYSQIL